VVSVTITVEWSDERLSMIWLFQNFVTQKSTKSGRLCGQYVGSPVERCDESGTPIQYV
jgi:hypothetical protein